MKLLIPKIIHQTWKDRAPPELFRRFVRSWKHHHPFWEYRLWDDEDNRNLIRDRYPWFLKLYDAYDFDIQRADAARYFILYTFGGLYVDLDFECLRSVEPLLEGASCVLGLENEDHARYHGVSSIVSNAFMAAVPRHHFFSVMTKELVIHVPEQRDANTFVLETTGPLMVTRVYDAYEEKSSVTLLPSHNLFPINYQEAERLLDGRESGDIRERIEGAYGIHYHSGSWWKSR